MEHIEVRDRVITDKKGFVLGEVGTRGINNEHVFIVDTEYVVMDSKEMREIVEYIEGMSLAWFGGSK